MKKCEEEKKSEPILFPPRPKAPIPVRIGAAIALLLLLWGLYLYASRSVANESETRELDAAAAQEALNPSPDIP